MNYSCEICGKEADVHHIVHKSAGGLDFDLNYKYLCPQHHRGKDGPHRDKFVDLNYKLEMQNKLTSLFTKRYYSLDDLSYLLKINRNSLKRLTKKLKLYKEGYLSEDVIFELMGRQIYSEEYLEDLLIEQLVLNL